MIREILAASVVGVFLLPPVCMANESRLSGANVIGGEYNERSSGSLSQMSGRLILAANEVADPEKMKQEKEAKKKKEELEKRKKAQEAEAERHKKVKQEEAERHKKAREQEAEKRKKAHDERGERRDHTREKHKDERRAEHKKQGKPGEDKVPVSTKPAAPATSATPATPAKAAAPAALAPAPAAPKQSLVIKTFPASGVSGGCATLNGYASDPSKSGKIWFEWGKTPSFGQASNAEAFTGEKSVGHRICSGVVGAKIYFRGVAQSGASLVYGETATFQ